MKLIGPDKWDNHISLYISQDTPMVRSKMVTEKKGNQAVKDGG